MCKIEYCQSNSVGQKATSPQHVLLAVLSFTQYILSCLTKSERAEKQGIRVAHADSVVLQA